MLLQTENSCKGKVTPMTRKHTEKKGELFACDNQLDGHSGGELGGQG